MNSTTPWPASASLQATQSLGYHRYFVHVLFVVVLAAGLALIYVPWQQNIHGYGRVIAHAPADRQQRVDSPIAGRVARFYVVEGQRVSAGDILAIVADNDPNLVGRLERERESSALRVQAARAGIEILTQRVTSLESLQRATISAAQTRLDMTQDRMSAAARTLDGALAETLTAELNFDRQQALHADGLSSKREVELAQLAVAKSRADRDRATASLELARKDIHLLKAELDKARHDADADVASAQSALRKAESDLAKEEQDFIKAESALARQESMSVRAPRDGTVLRLSVAPGADMLKAGDPILILVPDTDSPAVELWVDGNDAPLVGLGRQVRINLEGWPAIQFVGWPSAALGTFGGTVALVDQTDDGAGKFRVVVVPDLNDVPWPERSILRQGVRANGWVLLDQVSIGYELWRHFNGFPPARTLEKSPATKPVTPVGDKSP